MAWDNFLVQLDDQSYRMQEQSTSVYFEDEVKKLLELNYKNKEYMYKYIMLVKKNRENITA